MNGCLHPARQARHVELRISEDAGEIKRAVMHVERDVEFARRIGADGAGKVPYAGEPVLSRRNRDAAEDPREAPVARIFIVAVK